jgi:alkaline phosphatase
VRLEVDAGNPVVEGATAEVQDPSPRSGAPALDGIDASDGHDKDPVANAPEFASSPQHEHAPSDTEGVAAIDAGSGGAELPVIIMDDAPLAFDAGVMAPMAKNVIFLVADGYGATSIDATRMFVNGNTAPLAFEAMPHRAWVSTHNARNEVTDSAAAGTALATGQKVDDAVVSVALPGNGADLKTALEVQKARGKRIAVVTTHTSVVDATPACFAGHSANRGNATELAATYFSETRPNVMFGLFDSGIDAPAAQAAGYTVVQNATQLAGLNLDVEHHVSGQFTEDTVPPLKVMALAALDILEDAPQGFFVMIEQEETDTANHANNMSRMLAGAVEFHDTVKAVLAWAAGRDDTLIVVGTDHETGGLQVQEAHPTAGAIPEHSYATTGHTSADVRFFATGVGASRLAGHVDNTDVFPMLAGYHATSCVKGRPCYATTLDVALHEGSPTTASAAGDTLEADFEPGLQDQSLLRFGNLSDYLPPGCTFQAAKLVLHGTRDSTQGIRLHRMLAGWSEDSTWSSFGGNGVQTNDIEASAVADADSDSFIVGINTLDVTSSVAAWLADPSSNFGWLVLGQGNDDAQFGSSEANLAPELRVYCD